MTERTDDDLIASLQASLPVMRERARDRIGLMFLIDDFQRALDLHLVVLNGTVSRFSGRLSDELKTELEPKLTGDLLTVLEMARNLTSRGGKALIE